MCFALPCFLYFALPCFALLCSAHRVSHVFALSVPHEVSQVSLSLCFALPCFALLCLPCFALRIEFPTCSPCPCFVLLCFALLCFALLCFAWFVALFVALFVAFFVACCVVSVWRCLSVCLLCAKLCCVRRCGSIISSSGCGTLKTKINNHAKHSWSYFYYYYTLIQCKSTKKGQMNPYCIFGQHAKCLEPYVTVNVFFRSKHHFM